MRKLLTSIVLAAVVAGGLTAPVSAQRGRGQREDQASAREEMQAGRNMPSREIERRIVPQMKGNDYLGLEYDPVASAYRLKFIKQGQVTWVDVDARTGRVLRISR
ncbi:MAG TPA: hypothetical protein VEB68_05470 [Croceibacterium sp.]|nr:hypothetical protein [Croceibacterium sp.]